jgi:hypothetical protein
MITQTTNTAKFHPSDKNSMHVQNKNDTTNSAQKRDFSLFFLDLLLLLNVGKHREEKYVHF